MQKLQEKFIYNSESCKVLEASVSKERLSTYVKLASSGTVEEGLKLYIYNTQLSESFYSPIQGLEVTLRNAIHDELSKTFGEEWLVSGHILLKHAQKLKVEEARARLKVLIIPKLIAELNLGFWVGILGRQYEDIWRHHLRRIFEPSKDQVLRRKKVHNILDKVRILRNRIAHHEPIIQRNLIADYSLILEMIRMICPVTSQWVMHHSRFEEVYNPKILSKS